MGHRRKFWWFATFPGWQGFTLMDFLFRGDWRIQRRIQSLYGEHPIVDFRLLALQVHSDSAIRIGPADPAASNFFCIWELLHELLLQFRDTLGSQYPSVVLVAINDRAILVHLLPNAVDHD